MTSTIKKRYKEAVFSMRDDSCIKLKGPYCSSLRHRRVIKKNAGSVYLVFVVLLKYSNTSLYPNTIVYLNASLYLGLNSTRQHSNTTTADVLLS
jgi:hypothetical protein